MRSASFFFTMTAVFLSAVVRAGGLPKCSLDDLSEKCEFFRKNADQAVFTLPDGSSFKNPMAKPPMTTLMTIPQIPEADQKKQQEAFEEAMNKNMEAQADLQDSLREFDSKFQIAVSSPMAAAQMSNALNMESSGQTVSGVDMSLPWPPERGSGRARMKTVKWAEFKAGFLDKLPAEKRKKVIQQIHALAKANPYLGSYGSLGYGGYGAGVATPITRLTGPSKSRQGAASVDRERDFVRLEALVQQAKELMLSEISQGKPYSRLSGDQKAQYDKVATVKYVAPTDPKIVNSPSCSGDVENAFYNGEDHTFSICPAMASFPPASLISTIAHELAHAIDPCNGHLSVYKVEKDEIAKARARGVTEDEKKFLSTSVSGAYLTASDSQKSIQAAEKKGWLERRVAGVPVTRYPQAVALKCFRDKIKIRTSNRERLRRGFVEWSRETSTGFGGRGLNEPQVDRLIDGMRGAYNPLCGIPGIDRVYSEVGETMADAWASKVLGRYLEKNPPGTTAEKLSPFALYFSGSGGLCSQSAVSQNRVTMDDPHPRHWERIDKIFLTDHRVRKAMGCEGDPKDICLRSMGTLRTPTTSAEGAAASGKDGQK